MCAFQKKYLVFNNTNKYSYIFIKLFILFTNTVICINFIIIVCIFYITIVINNAFVNFALGPLIVEHGTVSSVFDPKKTPRKTI